MDFEHTGRSHLSELGSYQIQKPHSGASGKRSGKGGESEPYDEWPVGRLRRRAAEIGIAGRSRMRKAQLVEALRNH